MSTEADIHIISYVLYGVYTAKLFSFNFLIVGFILNVLIASKYKLCNVFLCLFQNLVGFVYLII